MFMFLKRILHFSTDSNTKKYWMHAELQALGQDAKVKSPLW